MIGLLRRWLAWSWRFLKELPVAVFSTLALVGSAVVMAAADVWSAVRGRGELPADTKAKRDAASVVIPNWNGRDLLEKYLPSVVTAMAGNPANEVIVVDNGSEDGSAEFVRERFPGVKVLALERNLGFGGGSNAGFREAKNDVVVLLNSDMRVEPDFLAPLLNGFTDAQVFAVSCQIFFSDPNKKREETGLTEGWWQQGNLVVGHRVEPDIEELFPTFYGGGGSCAFDRRKFLELGGFDPLYEPFYYEDTDLGYMAWKRGWKVLYQPGSVVYHEHRGTIGKKFSNTFIQGVLKRNQVLITWKNIHSWGMLASHFFFIWAQAILNWFSGEAPGRASFAGIGRAALALPRALGARRRAQVLSKVDDREAFRRPLGGHFRDTFGRLEANPERLSVLFVAPYPICPPTHGGGVFMYQTVRELSKLCDLHLIVLLDHADQRAPHEELDGWCASTEYIVRLVGREKALGSTEPHAPREFRNRDLAWLIQSKIYRHQVDVVQLEYLVMGQYAGRFRQIPSVLFEHDVYFQSIARRLPHMGSWQEKIEARWEYLRALRYELRMLPRMDRVQVCSRDNREYLESFLPELAGRVDDGYRAGVTVSEYPYHGQSEREPMTMLFLGSFRHLPNVEALDWFLKRVFPLIRKREPEARLVIVGSDPPPRHSVRDQEAIEMRGFVEDVREPLGRYAVFVCPILAGSGVRVKLIEAFAAGIPVVSTTVGAEGLVDSAQASGGKDICSLADQPEAFADQVLALLEDRETADQMAEHARSHVERNLDMPVMTRQMVGSYREMLAQMRR